jgi:transposase
MRQVKEVFRLHFVEKKSQAAIGSALGLGKTTVGDYLRRLNKTNLSSWLLIDALTDAELESALGFTSEAVFAKDKTMPDWNYVHAELAKRHVTMSLLWTEYQESSDKASSYGYTQFCEHYRRWSKKLSVVMRQTHKAGEKTFIDYSGDSITLVDPKTGEQIKTELFVAALGASSYVFAEVTLTQKSPDWVSSHVRMAEFFGGATEIWVPDNLKSGVTKADRYEALLNETYRECARHYGTCVIPARVVKPKDKAKAEASVLVAQRWILARLRNRLFTSLTEINEAIAECLKIINNRKMRHVNKSRHELYLELDRPVLKGLPSERYEYAVWKLATVNIDYHITFDHHHYSAPYQLVSQKCDVRATASTIELFHRGKRVASHRRSYKQGAYTTCKEHMPKSHREFADWTPERVVKWSKTIGEKTALLVAKILSSRVHPQQGFRSALGLIRLADRYGKERVERASGRALELGAHSYKFVSEMLKNKMDQATADGGFDESPMAEVRDPVTNEIQLALLSEENIRGSGYYH